MTPTDFHPSPSALQDWRSTLCDVFSVEDIRVLCFDLNIDFDNLSGESKTSKIVSLLNHARQHQRLAELVEYCSFVRPNRDWYEFLRRYSKEAEAMKVLCEKCLASIDDTDQFCKICGAPVGGHTGDSVSIETGKGSVNVGVGSLPNAKIHVGDVYGEQKKTDEVAYIDRTSVHEFRVVGISPRTSWMILAGVLGVVGSLSVFLLMFIGSASLHLDLGSLLLWFAIFSVSLILLFFGLILHRLRFLKAGLLPINIEAGSDGRVYFTKVGGTCPLCGASLRLVNMGPEYNNETIVSCSRNPSRHRWLFDPTVLPDLS